MRVVLDSNVVVSRFLSPSGPPAHIWEQWEDGVFELAVSEAILAEYQKAMTYERIQARHRMSKDEISKIISTMRMFAEVVEATQNVEVIVKDPEDNKFIDCALAAAADYIVSGDSHLLELGEYRDVQILSPTMFLELLRQKRW
ncbi:MAG: putative toxin-antitoxin system toxin component, PIN family [Chloroflexi bacterium]|nr:putative toxin-antitoxin system toxin component, PIN family [Chloroflexota bacterium]